MPTPPKSNSGGGRSIRLNLPGRSTTPPPSKSSTSPPQSKKRRFTPPASVRPNTAEASNLRLLHQKSSLSFVLHRTTPTSEPSWHAQGVTSLYVLDESSTPEPENSNLSVSLALHLRGTCQVTGVQVESVNKNDLSVLAKLSCTHQHLDPLERVLLKPANSYTMDDVIAKAKRHQADSQSSRGAAGMTNAIRAASIASNMGELRISTFSQKLPEQKSEEITQCWKEDLSQPVSEGDAVRRLRGGLNSRVSKRRSSRIDLVSKAMGEPTESQIALKVTVRFNIVLGTANHLGGINAVTSNQTPHIYTTAGVYGDHQGPRSWIPTLDSASTKHRSSHDITIKVTAPMNEGLSIVGFGEDYGVTETYLHDRNDQLSVENLYRMLGKDHVAIVQKVANISSADQDDEPHLIPPESYQTISMENILATTIWSSCSWLPIPCRSLGFAIGPFRVLEDPEYFGGIEEDDTSEDADEAREALEVSRENGEGIRQVYFAPLFARKHVHAEANTELIPNTRLRLSPLTSRQTDLCEGLDQSVLTATVGVPHRALSLVRDILALPAFRTVSYTQIWIPNAVHGGSTSGALHCCPEVLVNPFLGGSIMDARLLPPIGHRLPYNRGGRVLQFLQARCAVRGWITSAIPLGGQDDVGQGYIHTLIESLLMSWYERGHGAYGEGKFYSPQ